MEFLKKNYNVFVWSQGDVPRIDLQVTIHKMFTDPDHSLIHKKRRKFALECLKVIEKEVDKFIKANVIRESHYPDCLANVVVAFKKGGSGEYVLTLPTLTRLAPKIAFHYSKLI